MLLGFEPRFDRSPVAAERRLHCLARAARRSLGIALGNVERKVRGAQFGEPEIDGLRGGLIRRIKRSLRKTANHRPVLVALSLLRQNQVGEGEKIHCFAFRFKGCPPFPECFKGRNPAQPGHQVDAEARHVGPLTANVNGVAAEQSIPVQGGKGNWRRFKLGKCLTEAIEVRVVEGNDQIQVPAKLRRAVENARHSSASKKGL